MLRMGSSQSMKDLGYKEVIVGSDLQELVNAIKRSSDWPRFPLLQRIEYICSHFVTVAFESIPWLQTVLPGRLQRVFSEMVGSNHTWPQVDLRGSIT